MEKINKTIKVNATFELVTKVLDFEPYILGNQLHFYIVSGNPSICEILGCNIIPNKQTGELYKMIDPNAEQGRRKVIEVEMEAKIGIDGEYINDVNEFITSMVVCFYGIPIVPLEKNIKQDVNVL